MAGAVVGSGRGSDVVSWKAKTVGRERKGACDSIHQLGIPCCARDIIRTLPMGGVFAFVVLRFGLLFFLRQERLLWFSFFFFSFLFCLYLPHSLFVILVGAEVGRLVGCIWVYVHAFAVLHFVIAGWVTPQDRSLATSLAHELISPGVFRASRMCSLLRRFPRSGGLRLLNALATFPRGRNSGERTVLDMVSPRWVRFHQMSPCQAIRGWVESGEVWVLIPHPWAGGHERQYSD